MIEPGKMREVLTRETGAPFEIRSPTLHDTFYSEDRKWFVMCPDVAYVEQTYFARAAWSDKNGNLWIGSAILFTSAGLIEASYAEERDGLLQNANLSYSDIDKELGEKFPEVLDRIKAYESKIAKLSTRLGVNLMVRRSGSDGGVVFFALVAKIDSNHVNRSTPNHLEGLVDTNLKALKQAFSEIKTL